MTGKSHHDSGRQGHMQSPEHDGRLKENREAGHTKGTTPGSEARQHEAGRSGGQSMGSSHGGHSGSSQRHDSSSGSSSDDLKSREYRDGQGNVHHHTRTSQETRNKKERRRAAGGMIWGLAERDPGRYAPLGSRRGGPSRHPGQGSGPL